MLSVNVLNNFDYGDVIDKKNFYTMLSEQQKDNDYIMKEKG